MFAMRSTIKTLLTAIFLFLSGWNSITIQACPPPPECDTPDRYVMHATENSTVIAYSENGDHLFLSHRSAPHYITYELIPQNNIGGLWTTWNWSTDGCGFCNLQNATWNYSGGQEYTRNAAYIGIMYSSVGAFSVTGKHNGYACTKFPYGDYIIPGSSNISMSGYVIKVDITRNGSVITDTQQTVDSGALINLGCSITPNDVYIYSIGFAWTVPGSKIKSYTYSTNLGQVVDIAGSDLDDPTVSYYWVDGGDGKYVYCDVSIAGHTFWGGAPFNVKRPTCQVVTNINNYAGYYLENSWIISLGNISQNLIGITFTASYSANGTNGVPYWIQVINHTLREHVDNNYIFSRFEKYNVSDVTIPYGTGLFIEDTPNKIVPANYMASQASDSYSTWLMFKSNIGGSIPVPLSKIDWNWSVQSIHSGDWGYVGSRDVSSPTYISAFPFPQWSGNIND
ncbi:MAG: hypothetical protein AB1656_25655 [Candidatus Omnitrophota bacterium]